MWILVLIIIIDTTWFRLHRFICNLSVSFLNFDIGFDVIAALDIRFGIGFNSAAKYKREQKQRNIKRKFW